MSNPSTLESYRISKMRTISNDKYNPLKSWNYVLQNECIDTYNECIEIFAGVLQKSLQNDQPKSSAEIHKIFNEARDAVFQYYYL